MTDNQEQNERMLRRKEAARYLTEQLGLPVAGQTLAKMAVNGGGPPFHKFDCFPLYRQVDLENWARAKLGPVISSISANAEVI